MNNPSLCRLLMMVLLQLFFASEILANTLILMCTHIERDFLETYELKMQSASSANSRPKVYLDGRDLDINRTDSRQFVKNVTITKQKASYLLITQFDAEVLEGISYSAGSVISIVTIDRETGRLRKLDTIQGGILGARLGDGTKSYEEQCVAQP